jgi:hypothetical protein
LKRRPSRLSSGLAIYSARGLDRLTFLRRLGRMNLLAVLATAVGAVLLAYLASGQLLLLLAAVLLAGAGAHQLLKSNPDAGLLGLRLTSIYLFVPVLFTFGAGVFFRYTLSGPLEILAAAVSGAILGCVIWAEYRSLDARSSGHFQTLRLILNLASYLAAFALYTALYNQQLPLAIASLLVGIVSLLIGVDILRELELPTRPLLVYAATLGFVMAEARWALNFVSLTGWLGGVFILVVFYVASQLMQAYLGGRLDRRVALEFSVVATIGSLLVIAGRVMSHG